MNARSIGYWITTALFTLALGASGVLNLVQAPPIVEGLSLLGYPAYFATILGTWKVLGVAAVLAPALPRLKEWAYAGFFFQLTGALASHLASGDTAIAAPFALLALGAASYALRPGTRVLGQLLPQPAPALAAEPAR